MTDDLQKQMEETITRVESVFTPGRLGDRRDEMVNLRESGDTMLFSGGVLWSIVLPDYDKKLNGESESLDAAFVDMSGCLAFLAKDHGDDTEVICAVEAVPENVAG